MRGARSAQNSVAAGWKSRLGQSTESFLKFAGLRSSGPGQVIGAKLKAQPAELGSRCALLRLHLQGLKKRAAELEKKPRSVIKGAVCLACGTVFACVSFFCLTLP